MWAAVANLLQGTVSRVILERSQAAGPRDSLQIMSGSEQGAFHLGLLESESSMLQSLKRAAKPL